LISVRCLDNQNELIGSSASCRIELRSIAYSDVISEFNVFQSLVVAKLLFGASMALGAERLDTVRNDMVEQGRYVVVIAGCNDCHTAGFAPAVARLPRRSG